MHPAAAEFFTHMVEPTVAEFEQAPYDVRRGRLAAIVLYHMADHFALSSFMGCDRELMNQEIEAARAVVHAMAPEFLLIRDVADASKHAKLAQAKRAPRQVSTTEQVSATPGLFEAPFGSFSEAAEVLVTLDDGTTLPLAPAIHAVLAAWRSMV